MNLSESGERWPFRTAGGPLSWGRFDASSDRATLAFVESAADATNVDPLALAPLNDRIDPDAAGDLLEAFPSDRRDGVRVAVEVSWDEVAVVVRDDGRVEAYQPAETPNQLEPTATRTHEWTANDSLASSIAEAVAAAADDDPGDVVESIARRIEVDAAESVLAPRPGGVARHDSRLHLSVDGYEVAVDPDGTIAVEPSLTTLKRSGAALLVVGAVPERELDRVSARLLGDPDEARSPVFALHGQNLDTARRRLSMAGFAPSEATVLDHRATARSASAASVDSGPDPGPEVVPVADEVTALPETVDETVAPADYSAPTDLRIAVDSVCSILKSNGLEETRAAFDDLVRTVHEERGMAHFLLPIDPAADEVAALEPLFDAVITLEIGDAGLRQEWRLTDTGYELPAFHLE